MSVAIGAAKASLAAARVLVVGAGGLGCPVATILARSGIGHITVLDDDAIDTSNLQRQTLFADADVGARKAVIAVERLKTEARANGHILDAVAREKRLRPENASDLVAGYHVVVEGADNFATKFLAADACSLAGVPLVQAGVVRWVGWAFANVPDKRTEIAADEAGACLRCVFEDVPRDQTETCAEAGVIGPVVGVVAALQAALVLRVLLGDASAAGELWSYRALEGALRSHRAMRNPSCPLCAGQLTGTPQERYAPSCAA